MKKLNREDELSKLRGNMFIGKKVRIVAEGSIVEGFVFAIEKTSLFMQDVTYKFISRDGTGILVDDSCKEAEIHFFGKCVFILKQTPKKINKN